MRSKIRVAFLTSSDPNDRNSWSGIHFQMLRSLEQQFDNVTPLGPVKMNKHRLSLVNLINLGSAIFLRQRYNVIHNKIFGRYYAGIFKKKLKDGGFDIIFAPASSVEIAFLKTDIPICYFSDTSFSQVKNYYGIFSNLSKFSERESELIQQRALKRSKIIIHASTWASEHVIEHYKIATGKVFTVPMGANIDSSPNLNYLELKLKNRSICHLIFLGTEWERKGGPIAFETLMALIELGLDAHLTVCGCIPPEEFRHAKMKIIPFIDKNYDSQYDQFLNLLHQSHFLLLPTRAECAGIVFAEASAFGIPSITTDTGGVSSMVENGVNGYRLRYDARGHEYASLIKTIFQDENAYKRLVFGSRERYETLLNWHTWGEKVSDIILNHHNNFSY